MRKILLISTCICVLIGLNISFADSFMIWVENDLITFTDQAPMIKDGRTLIPIRTVERLGYTFDWNQDDRTVKVISDLKSEMIFT